MTTTERRGVSRRPRRAAGAVTGRPRTAGGPGVTGAFRIGAPYPSGDRWERPAKRRRLTGRQSWWLALVAIVLVALGSAGGWAATRVIPAKYAAHADVLYAMSTEQPTGFLREDRNITTQLVLLQSRTVLEPVAEQWGLPVQKLATEVDASVVNSSEIIRITLIDHDAERAQRMLRAVVDRYVEVSSDDARTRLREYINGELTDILDRISQLRPDADTRAAELGALVEREQWLRKQLDELQFSNIAGPAVSVLVQPYTDPSPISPRPLVTTAAGAFAGLLLALFTVALVARRMTRS